ncbi:MAG: hypothetical protein Wins2KO_09200 [Winogradskyella sp.]
MKVVFGFALALDVLFFLVVRFAIEVLKKDFSLKSIDKHLVVISKIQITNVYPSGFGIKPF